MPHESPLDLGWLLRLRWFGYAGALGSALLAQRWFELELNVGALALLTGVGLLSNAVAQFWPGRRGESPARLTVILSLDVLLLCLALASSGAGGTPLVLAFLVPLVIAAATLPRWSVILVLLEALTALALLGAYPRELLADHEHAPSGPDGVLAAHGSTQALDPHGHAALHLDGAWWGVGVVGLLVVVLVRRALVDRERRIDALRRDNERAERLAELSTLAASATHALGSPLAIISVISRELERSLERNGDPDDLADVRAIREQVERCREVLGNMANDARTGKEPDSQTSLGELCESARRAAQDPELVELRLEGGESLSWVPRRSLLQVIASLLDNAADAAPGQRIELRARAHGAAWRIEVCDRGATPERNLEEVGHEPGTTKPFGMGIGLFLGRAILERLGGTLELQRHADGTTAVLLLPTAAAGPELARGAPA